MLHTATPAAPVLGARLTAVTALKSCGTLRGPAVPAKSLSIAVRSRSRVQPLTCKGPLPATRLAKCLCTRAQNAADHSDARQPRTAAGHTVTSGGWTLLFAKSAAALGAEADTRKRHGLNRGCG